MDPTGPPQGVIPGPRKVIKDVLIYVLGLDLAAGLSTGNVGADGIMFGPIELGAHQPPLEIRVINLVIKCGIRQKCLRVGRDLIIGFRITDDISPSRLIRADHPTNQVQSCFRGSG